MNSVQSRSGGFPAAICLALILVCIGCQVPPEAAEKSSDDQLTEELLRQELAQRRDQAVALYVDAMMLSELNDHAEAIRKLEMATDLDPDFALAFSLKGDIFQQIQDYEKSAQAYEKATKIDPWSFRDFFNLGNVYQILKDFAKAVKAYVAACNLDPGHFEAHYKAARCFYTLQEYDQSMEYARMAKAIDPQQPGPEILLGELFESRKDHVEAINAYRRALELEGNKPEIMLPLARAYLRSGRYSAARELLAVVADMEPDNSMAHQYMGFALLRLRELPEAIESYKRAVETADQDYMAHKSLGVAYMIQFFSNRDEASKALALEQWTISLQINPDQPKLKQFLTQYR